MSNNTDKIPDTNRKTMAENIYRLLMRTLFCVMFFLFVIQVIQGLFFGRRITDFVRKYLNNAGTAMMTEYEDLQDDALSNLAKTKAYKTDEVLTDSYSVLEFVRMITEQTVVYDNTGTEIRIDLPDKSAKKGEVSSYYQLGKDCDTSSAAFREDLGMLSNVSKFLEEYYTFQDNLQDIFIYTKNNVMLHTNRYEASCAQDKPEVSKWLNEELDGARALMNDEENILIEYYNDLIEKDGIAWSVPFYKGDELYGSVVIVIDKSFFDKNIKADLRSEDDICCIFYNDSVYPVFSTDEDGVFKVNGESGDNNPEESFLLKEEPEASKKLMEDIKKNKNGKTKLTLRKPIAGSKSVTVYYAYVKSFSWTIAVIRPDSVAQKAVESFQNQVDNVIDGGNDLINKYLFNTIFTVLLFLGVGSAISYYLSSRYSRRLAEPMRSLSEKVEQLDGDNLQFSWENNDIDKETSVLVDAFSRMTKRMSDDIKRIRDYTAKQERMQAELNVAADIQRGILPDESSDFCGTYNFRLNAFMTPAREVGGDLYDYFMIDEDHLGIVIGDVSGKGVPAALFMTVTKTLLKSKLMEHSHKPAQILSAVNERLCEGNTQMMFVTVWIGVLEISTGRLLSANAGHDFPMVRRGGEPFELIQEDNFVPLGVMEDAEFPQNELTLGEGDIVFVYTDGIPEAVNEAGEQFTETRMLEALNEVSDNTPKEIEENMITHISEFVGEEEQFDDITMLCLKIGN